MEPSKIVAKKKSICNGKYVLTDEVLGEGRHGRVVKGIKVDENIEVAIKYGLDKRGIGEEEFEIHQELSKLENSWNIGIPKIYDQYSDAGVRDYLVMELLGENLESLFIRKGKKFDVQTIAWIGLQILEILEFFHTNSYVFVDMSTKNFLIGRGKLSSKLFVIDFAFSQRYIMEDGEQLPFCEDLPLQGTALYASDWNHYGIEYAPRDDLVALGYMLFRFLLGSLPWEDSDPKLKTPSRMDYLKFKLWEEEDLKMFVGAPEGFVKYLEYCYHILYVQHPDYDYLKKLFRDMLLVDFNTDNLSFLKP